MSMLNYILKVSIKYTILLIFCFVLKCSSWNECLDGVCFYSDGTNATSLAEAQELCHKNGSKLLELIDEQTQNSFVSVANKWIDSTGSFGMGTAYVWLNLKAEMSDWTWVTGKKYNSSTPVQGSSYNYYGLINYLSASNRILVYSTPPENKVAFICADENCKNASCLTFITNLRTNWYDARYECTKIGRDLAVLDWVKNYIEDVPELIQNADTDFWIGLYKQEYRWQDSKVPMKYINWAGVSRVTFDCARAVVGAYRWVISECSGKSSFVVCMKESDPISTAPTSMTSNVPSSFTPITLSTIALSSTPASDSNLFDTYSSVLTNLEVGFIVGISLFVILNVGLIIGVYIYCKKNNSHSKSGTKSTSVITDENTSRYEGINKNTASSMQQIYTPLSDVQ